MSHIEVRTFAAPLPEKRVDELSLFEFALDRDSLDLFESVLTPEELEAADRRRGSRLRDRFIVARGASRIVLGAYVNRPARSLTFSRGHYGKPTLPGGPAFNLSHSQGAALLVVSTAIGMDASSLGVDLEHVRDWPDLDELAQTVYTPPELLWRESKDLEEGERRDAFFKLWTAKESYMKATGEGLSCPLQGFRIEWKASERLGTVCSYPDGVDLDYRTLELPMSADVCAALCLRSRWKDLPRRRFRIC